MITALEIHITSTLGACTLGHVRYDFNQFLVPDGIIRFLLGRTAHLRFDGQFACLRNNIFDHVVLDASALELIVQLNLHVLFFWCAFLKKF